MVGKERTLRTITFRQPDQIPLNLWVHEATRRKYGPALEKLLQEFPQDIVRVFGPMDRVFYPQFFEPGLYKDHWGSTWQILLEGMSGEVKIPAIPEPEQIRNYRIPLTRLQSEWEKGRRTIEEKIETCRKAGQFIVGGQIEIFQRMQFLRGTENLFYDLGEENEDLLLLRDQVVEYFHHYLDYWISLDVDGILFTDDWGSQRALLISPEQWRRLFKPVYWQLFNRIKSAGKFVFFHSDGYILDLYPEFIELGVDALNSQIWCMGLEQVALFAGKLTFWGEIDRQKVLAFGTPADVRQAVGKMKELLYRDGGLIGQGVAGVDVPLDNIRAMLDAWN